LNDQLLIIGASGRAAAESARRAGITPLVLDAFGDDDTRRIADCRVAERYPSNLVAEAAQFPAAAWMFVGGLENSPAIVDRLACGRRLLGIAGASLRRVRDPEALRASLAIEGMWFPEYRTEFAGIPRDGSWLLKSRRSAGGLGISVFNEYSGPQIDSSRYFERRVGGRSCGITFVGQNGDARLVGAVEQFVSNADPRRPFLFGGAIGPLDLPVGLTNRLTELGRLAAREFGLAGLFGIDVVIDGDAVWVLEVNPRYTASVELLEHALDRPLLAQHVQACRGESPVGVAQPSARNRCGKRIVYAGSVGRTVKATFTESLWNLRGERALPAVADIPTPGARIEPFSPLATVLAEGADIAQVAGELGRLAAEVERRFELTCDAE
jgi:predicted ATP-grasp superfamily ATP-dependent carboligase